MRRYIQNDTTAPIFAGGVMILPGTGREVDLPPELDDLHTAEAQAQAEEVEAPLAWPLALVALQALSVAKLKPELDKLSDADLATLALVEEAAELPRSTVLELIATHQLKRAQAKAGGEPT
jgi:hypothetical protein